MDGASYSGGAIDSTYPLMIGEQVDGTGGLNGRVDEVVYYKRSLSAGERTWLYNNGIGHTYADLNAAPSGTAASFTYDSNHKHAVASLSTGESYTYDANGNMTCRVEGGVTYKQDYNIENQLTGISKMNGSCATGTISETTSFLYDGDGSLVMTTKPGGGKTIYVGGVYEEDKTGNTVTHTRVYYPAGGAMRIDGTLYYVLKDHLGSASIITDASGNALTNGEQRYYPFGESRFTTANMLTDKLYTGQRQITSLGIYHYGARFYSPYINHFIQPDTIIPDQYNPQNLSRYSYVVNNPLRYTDPTGHMQACEDGDVCRSPNTNSNSGTGSGGHHRRHRHEDDPDPTNAAASGGSGGKPLLAPSTTSNGSQSSTSGYCGGGPNSLYNFFDCGANITQDWALAIDTPFAGLDAVLITAGCFAGLEGCLAGAAVADAIFNALGANFDETTLSFASMTFSIFADAADDGHLGQDSAISVVAAVGGAFSPDPILDFAIDGFGSAYNHEVHPIYDIFSH